MRKLLLVVAMLLGVVAGCEFLNPIGPAIQLGIYWMEGEAHKYYNADQKTTLAGLKASLAELEIPVTEETESDGVVHLRAGGKMFVSDDTGPRRLGFKAEKVELKGEDRFKIKVTVVKPRTTKVSIRANVFGDKPYCELIYRTLDRQPGVKGFVSVAEFHAN